MNQIREGTFHFRGKRPKPEVGQVELCLKDESGNPLDCLCKITSCEKNASGAILWGHVDVETGKYLVEISLRKNLSSMDGVKISKNNSFILNSEE